MKNASQACGSSLDVAKMKRKKAGQTVLPFGKPLLVYAATIWAVKMICTQAEMAIQKQEGNLYDLYPKLAAEKANGIVTECALT